MKLKQKIRIFFAVFFSVFALSATDAFAVAVNYTFQMSLTSVTEDTANAGLFGKPTWYQWLYEVKAVTGGSVKTGLSHFTVGLEDCFSGALLSAVASTAGANGNPPNAGNLSGLVGNELRTYTVSTGTDGSTGLYGIKWDLGTDNFDNVGDIDYFWFSAPAGGAETNDVLVKRGGGTVEATLDTPACPECHEPAIPEPATVLLFSSGLVGTLIRRRLFS